MNLILAVQMVSALVMIGLILIQHGKGADMGAAFGSGSSGSLFGATGSANFLSRTTAILATVFFVATLLLAYFGNLRTGAPAGGSVLEGAALAAPAIAAASTASAAAVPAPVASGAAQIPSK
jgi:preprotein translocase subunit SecG